MCLEGPDGERSAGRSPPSAGADGTAERNPEDALRPGGISSDSWAALAVIFPVLSWGFGELRVLSFLGFNPLSAVDIAVNAVRHGWRTGADPCFLLKSFGSFSVSRVLGVGHHADCSLALCFHTEPS